MSYSPGNFICRVVCLLLISSATAAEDDLRVETLAGNGSEDWSSMPQAARQTGLAQPFGVAVSPSGEIYVCSVGSHVVQKINADGELVTVAGCGRPGFSGDGGPALRAELNEPYEIRFAADGTLFIVEMQNHLVRRVDLATGLISTVAGTGERGFSGDGGQAKSARFSRPHSIALDQKGGLYIADIGNHRVRRVDLASGEIRTLAGDGRRRPTPSGSGFQSVSLNGPRALIYDGRSSLYLALREGNAIYRMDLAEQRLIHLAGSGRKGYSGDGGLALEAELSGPKGVAVGPNGDVYFADTESHTIRVFRANRQTVETVVGDGQRGDGPDGPPLTCRLDRPHGVFVTQDGRLLIGDSNNHKLRSLQLAAGK